MSTIKILSVSVAKFDILKTRETTKKVIWKSVDMKMFDIPYLDIYLYAYVTKHMNRGNNLK